MSSTIDRQASATSAALIETRRQFGENLRKMREQHGFSAQAMAQSTRISQVFIDSMEAGAFEKLPGQVFGRGFLRGLCKQLQADPEELLRDYDACWGAPPAKSVLKVQIKNKPRPDANEGVERALSMLRSISSPKTLVRIVVPVAAVCGLGYALFVVPAWKQWLSDAIEHSKSISASFEQSTPVETPKATRELIPAETGAKVDADVASPQDAAVVAAEPLPVTAPEPEIATEGQPEASAADLEKKTATTSAAVPAVAAPTPENSGKLASLTPGDQVLELVATEPVRVRVELDDGQVETKELKAQTYRFSFKSKAELMVYDAAALKVSFNGRPLGSLGNKGRVRRLSFEAAPTTDKKL